MSQPVNRLVYERWRPVRQMGTRGRWLDDGCSLVFKCYYSTIYSPVTLEVSQVQEVIPCKIICSCCGLTKSWYCSCKLTSVSELTLQIETRCLILYCGLESLLWDIRKRKDSIVAELFLYFLASIGSVPCCFATTSFTSIQKSESIGRHYSAEGWSSSQ